MESHGELKRGMVLKFVHHYCLPPQMLWRVMDSYEELRRAMGRKVHLTFKYDQKRATESYGELRRSLGVTESNGLIF